MTILNKLLESKDLDNVISLGRIFKYSVRSMIDMSSDINGINCSIKINLDTEIINFIEEYIDKLLIISNTMLMDDSEHNICIYGSLQSTVEAFMELLVENEILINKNNKSKRRKSY